MLTIHTLFLTEETSGNDNERSEEDEVQSEELDDFGADEDYRPGSHDDDDPSDGDISSEDSGSRGAGDTNNVGSLYTVIAEEPNLLYVNHEEEVETSSK